MSQDREITTTIRGSATRVPRSAGRVPFSDVRLSEAGALATRLQ
jgi:hypothetical protein